LNFLPFRRQRTQFHARRGLIAKSTTLPEERKTLTFVKIMSKALATVLTTVNAPYSEQLDGVALAHCLSDLALAKQHPGQVSGFLGEVPLAQQIEFATTHQIPVNELKSLAAQFAAWSGESYQLAA
jgi:hypothetical protein